jgi:hypothetical protein
MEASLLVARRYEKQREQAETIIFEEAYPLPSF